MTKRLIIYVTLIFLCASPMIAEERQKTKEISIRNITAEYFSGRGGGFERKGLSGLESVDQTSGKWVRIEIQYKSKSDWIGRIDLHFYALLGTKQKPVLLDKIINQINIDKGLDHYAVVFIHPQTIKRYGPVQLAGVQIEQGGFVEDFVSWPHSSNKKWWEDYTPMHGYMKDLRQSPFLLNNPGKYEDTLEEN
ncbi:MAG: hypothetical protein Q8Q33_10625 [Chlamydiota bacterium]|nr:hypothetical protein [Chlamydiota bacterium]